jgi:membrane protease subunit HflK
MAWNQPSEDDKQRARGAASGTSSKGLEGALRRWQQHLDGFGAGGTPRRVAATLLVIAASAWLATGMYRVAPTERALVLRFDHVVAELGPGAGLRWPWPIETVRAFDVETPQSIEYQVRALTPDIAMVDVGCRLDYLLASPRQLLAAGPDMPGRVRAAGELALRETLGTTGLALLLDAEQRSGIGQAVSARAQQLLDAEELGVRVTGVQISDVQMPAAVQSAQRELAKVQGERAGALQAARTYAAAVLPRARAEAERLVLEAQAVRAQSVTAAEAEAAHFSALVPAYQQAPELTRQRLYIETIESILAGARKIVIDTRTGSGDNMIYLPLDKLMEAGVRLPAATLAAPGAVAAPGVAPAVPAAAGATAAGAAGEGAQRSRERDQRERESR